MRTPWNLIWLFMLVLGGLGTVANAKSSAASVPFTFDYDEPTTANRGPSTSVIGYDAAREHAADETRNATAGTRVLFAGVGEFFAAKSEATLFRVVGPDELSGIQQAGRYTPSPGGLVVKYFYPTAEQAANFAANPANRQFGPFTLTSTKVPTSVINSGSTINVAREGTVI